MSIHSANLSLKRDSASSVHFSAHMSEGMYVDMRMKDIDKFKAQRLLGFFDNMNEFKEA